VLRPVSFPFSLANRVIVWMIAHTSSITGLMNSVRNKTYAQPAAPVQAKQDTTPRSMARGAGAN